MTIAEDLQAMSTALGELIPKEHGNLVRSDDWNILVGQVLALLGVVETQQVNYENNVTLIEDNITLIEDNVTRIEAIETELTVRVQAIEDLIGESGDEDGTIVSRLDTVEEDKLDKVTFAQYQATLDPLLLQYTVTLETEDSRYLLGETATLTAIVRSLDGSAVTARPWLDFLISWGDIQAVSGFETRPGAGGRSTSVRTDSEGIARVRIKAENLARTSTSVDNEMVAFFATEISAQNQSKVMRRAIMDAPNPQDSFMRVMYEETTRRYDDGALGIRSVTDQYYLGRYRGPVSDRVFRGGSWKDHRSTIAVFAKDDSNPETPDSGKGVSSIQINFRDWISPWIEDYGPQIVYRDDIWKGDITDLLRDPKYQPKILIDYVEEQLTGLGLLGKHKVLESVGAAIGQVDESLINPGVGPLIDIIGDAVKTQKSMDIGTFGDAAVTGRGLAAISLAVQQAAGTGVVQGQVKSVESQLVGIDSKTSSLETNHGVLNDRISATTAQGENVMLVLGSIDNKVANINIVDADSVRGSVSAIKADIAALRFNLER